MWVPVGEHVHWEKAVSLSPGFLQPWMQGLKGHPAWLCMWYLTLPCISKHVSNSMMVLSPGRACPGAWRIKRVTQHPSPAPHLSVGGPRSSRTSGVVCALWGWGLSGGRGRVRGSRRKGAASERGRLKPDSSRWSEKGAGSELVALAEVWLRRGCGQAGSRGTWFRRSWWCWLWQPTSAWEWQGEVGEVGALRIFLSVAGLHCCFYSFPWEPCTNPGVSLHASSLSWERAFIPRRDPPQTGRSLPAAPRPAARLLEPHFLLRSRSQVLVLGCPASSTCLGPSSGKCLELNFLY